MRVRSSIVFMLLCLGLIGFTKPAASIEMRTNPDTGEIELITPEMIEEEKRKDELAQPFEERINLYYKMCKAAPRDYLLEDERTSYCACVSSAMMQQMTPEELNFMEGSGTRAYDQKLRKFMFADGFCATHPIRSMIMRDCRNLPNIKNPATCTCIANDVWKKVSLFAPGMMERHIRFKKGSFKDDAIRIIIDSSPYRSTYNHYITECVAMYE
ncbi:MAG: hypothetical protein KTR28_01760 [Micavibrio sp.]|nr:hypothetical protein [Micavibrio sp.]